MSGALIVNWQSKITGHVGCGHPMDSGNSMDGVGKSGMGRD